MLADSLVEEFEIREDEPWYDQQDLQQGEPGRGERERRRAAGGSRRRGGRVRGRGCGEEGVGREGLSGSRRRGGRGRAGAAARRACGEGRGLQ